MRKNRLISAINYFNINIPTWQRQNKHSQIDNIWIPPNIIPSYEILKNTSANEITNSDYSILSINWNINFIIQKIRTKKRRR